MNCVDLEMTPVTHNTCPMVDAGTTVLLAGNQHWFRLSHTGARCEGINAGGPLNV